MNNMNDSHETQLSAACLLLSVAEADEILEEQELDTIQDILKDFAVQRLAFEHIANTKCAHLSRADYTCLVIGYDCWV